MRIYRWHITRKLENPSLDDDTTGKIDVMITPAREEFPTDYFKKPIRSLYELPPDDLVFWEDKDDLKLEGWTTESALIEALLQQNLIEDASWLSSSEVDRRIVEDMVLLEIVDDVEAFLKIWKVAQKDQDLPDLTGLVTVNGAHWIDFTMQARRLSKEIYNRVLAVMRERGYAEKS